jgi:DNA primase
LDDPKVKADLAKQILPLIEDVADRVEREAYRQFMARRLKVDERALLGLRSRPRKPRARSKPTLQSGLQPEGKGQRDSPLERFCVGVLLENPELLYRIDRQLQTLELERLTPGDFTGTERQEIFHAIQAALAQDDQEPSLYWREYLGELLGQIAEEILSELAKFTKLSELSMDHPKVIDEISARFLQLRKRNLDAELMNLHFLMQIAEEEGTGEVERLQEFKEKVSRLAVQKSHLERALARRQGFIRTVTTGPEW